MNIRLDLPFVASFLGLAYAFEGRPNEGLPLLEEAVQEATTLKLRSGQSWLLGMLAYAYMFAERLREAEELAQQAIDLAQQRSERSWMAWAQYFLGQIRLANGNPDLDAARVAYEAGLTEARTLGLLPLVARFELGLGQLHRRTRDTEAAYGYLHSAVSSLREMQMPHWLHKAEAELKQLQV
jgi:tetratricopeptide (TPR) repeat protein